MLMATYYTSRYSGEEIDKLLDRVSGMETNPAEALARLGAGVRPNLLDNWYFADPVNQRGQTSYSGEIYTIDRWKNASGDTKVLLSDDGLIMDGGTAFLAQKFEDATFNALNGKTITLSSLWTDNVLNTFSWVFDKRYSIHDSNSLLAYHPVWGFFVSRIIGAGNQATCAAAKLEIGAQQTLGYQDEDGAWHLLPQPESDYATQLARCQRYQIPIDGIARYPIVQIADANTLLIFIPLPVTMRTAPALSDPDGKLIIYDQIGAAQTGFTFDVAAFCSNGITLRAQKVNHGITGGFLYVNVTTGVDAPFLVANL